MKKPNIFLIGPMGAGKSSIGREIARLLHLDFYDSDAVIEQQTGADIPWIFDVEGKEGFYKRETKVIAELIKKSGIVLATGGITVAVVQNRKLLQENGIIVYLKVTLRDQLERTNYSKKRPIASEKEVRRKVLESLQIELEPLYEELADLVYSTNSCSVGAGARAIVKKLRNLRYL